MVKSSQKRRRNIRHLAIFDDGENAEFLSRFGQFQASKEAKIYGNSVAGFIRYATIGKSARPLSPSRTRKRASAVQEKVLLRILAELGKSGSNLNQIARALNSDRGDLPMPIQDAMASHIQATEAIRTALGFPSSKNDEEPS